VALIKVLFLRCFGNDANRGGGAILRLGRRMGLLESLAAAGNKFAWMKDGTVVIGDLWNVQESLVALVRDC